MSSGDEGAGGGGDEGGGGSQFCIHIEVTFITAFLILFSIHNLVFFSRDTIYMFFSQ